MATIGHYEKVRALAANVRLLVLGGARTSAASQLTVFDHVAGKPKLTIDVPAHVLGVALLSDGDKDRIVAACADGHLRVYDAGTGKAGRDLSAHTGAAVAVVAAGEDRVYTAGADGAVRRFALDARGQAPTGEWIVSPQGLRALAVDPTGEYVAAAGDDGVVHVVQPGAPAGTPVRDMPGHDGAVTALSFTPRDGRLVSGGEDGALRLWYLVGAVESEVRATDAAGAVLSILFPPTPPQEPNGDEPTDRIFAGCADGKVRVFRLEDRRKPRTLECGSKGLWALCHAPPPPSQAKKALGAVFIAGEARTVYSVDLELDGTPGDKIASHDHGFAALSQTLGSQRPAREATYKTLAALDEPEALEILLRQLAAEKEADLRAQIAHDLGQRGRRPARAALRIALDDAHVAVRRAALSALRALEGPQNPLSPARAALRSRHPSTRKDGLSLLGGIGTASPLVPGLVIAALNDQNAAVRLHALSVLTGLHAAGSAEPLRVAFERGPADIRAEVLVRGAFAGLLQTPELFPLLQRALDDEDAEVRRIAFALLVLLRRPLADHLDTRDEDFARTTREIARRGTQPVAEEGAPAPKDPTEAELNAARAKLLATLVRGLDREARSAAVIDRAPTGKAGTGTAPGEEDLQPLLTAMSCRTPHTALRGARGLALLGDTRALGALLQLSREAEPALRRQAASALRALSDPRARKRLVWMLDDGDADVRAEALSAYSELVGAGPTTGAKAGAALAGDAAAHLQVAEAALHSSHEDIRVRGLERLVKLGTEGQRTPAVESLLGDALEDESPKVRAEALRTLWSWHERDPQRVLDRALLCRFPDQRQRAVEELTRLGQADWARSRLQATVADRDAGVATAAFEALVKLRGKVDAESYLLAVASTHPGLRETAAQGAVHVSGEVEPVRAALVRLLDDENPGVRTAALETLDRRAPRDAAPHYAALQGQFLDLRVRAAELLAVRHDERLIEPMRSILTDKDLWKRFPADFVKSIRLRAAMALATLGSPRTVKYLATELIKDDAGDIREQAARGLATAARPGDEGYLLDMLGHGDIWVRSWAADGLSRLGDARALPVLTGTLRHEHLPIRFSAIVSFAALGPEGYGGMLQGLEDPSRDVQEIIFSIVLSRDLQAFRRGQPPDLLASALSSQRAEVRFAAARALELRTDPEVFLAHVIETLMPPRPDKKEDMKDWPAEEPRGRILLGLAEALAGDSPEVRYAAAQVLRLKKKPLEYFREASRVARPRAVGAGLVPDTAPVGFDPLPVNGDSASHPPPAPKKGWLRRLFHGDDRSESRSVAPIDREARSAAVIDRAHLIRLAFGAYVGLLRQVTSGEDERVRRDAVDRIVELGQGDVIGFGAALPAVVRALDDPHYLVRKAAFAGLKRLYPAGSDEPVRLALRCTSADVARAALDEVAERTPPGTAVAAALHGSPIAAALSSSLSEVRKYAFELLERLAPPGSLEPLLLALQSEYSDLRIGVIERLATQRDDRVTAALQRAMESDHDDLRLRAAELLAERRDDRAADVLGALLRSEDGGVAARAHQALLQLGSEPAVRALAARLERDEDTAGAQVAPRVRMAEALGQTGHPAAVEPLAACFDDESAELRQAALRAALQLCERAAPKVKGPRVPLPFGGPDGDEATPVRYEDGLLLKVLRAAARARDPELRRRAAEVAGERGALRGAEAGQAAAVNELLCGLFTDRDAGVRRAAVSSYGARVIDHHGPVEPLLGVLRAGARDLLMPAAEGAAHHGQAAALRPLLLLSRAGEEDERGRAVLALGTLGDGRALAELETVAAGGTKDAPVEEPMRAAAVEALGRLAGKLTDAEAQRRVIDKIEELAQGAPENALQKAAIRGLRYIGQAQKGERARVKLEAILLDDALRGDVQGEAAKQLGLLGDAAAEGALSRALHNWDSDVYEPARRALDRLFPNDRVRVEFLAVDSRVDEVSQPAVAFLSLEGDPAQLLPRLATLRDEDLRRRLRYGLLRRKTLLTGGLVSLLKEKDPAAREAAAWLVGARAALPGAIADAGLLPALVQAEASSAERYPGLPEGEQEAEERAWTRLLWAATNLSQSGSAGAELLGRARALLTAAGSKAAGAAQAPSRPPTAVVLQALRALSKLGTGRDADAAAVLLTDGDAGVRAAAAAALAKLAPERAFGVAEKVKPFDPVAFAAAAVAPPAGAMGTAAGRSLAVPALVAAGRVADLVEVLRRGKDAAARLDAAAALGRLGDEPSMAALRATAFDKQGADEALRKAAYRAYRRAGRRAALKRKHEAHA